MPDEAALEAARQQGRNDATAALEKEHKKQLKEERTAAAEKATKEAEKKAAKDMDDLKASVDAAKNMAQQYKDKLDALDREKQEATQRAAALEKKMAVESSPDTVKFSVYFDSLQGSHNQMMGVLKKMKDSDRPSAEKMQGAMLKYCEIMRKSIEEVLK